MITVISTGRNAPTKARCLRSVEVQTEQHEHIYIESPADRTVTQNVYEVVRELPPDRIVAWLDGDDWLAHDEVLARVRTMHSTECSPKPATDCTYGSFRFSDGRSGNCRAYEDPKNCRQEPWLGTHLKTFRARLLQSVPETELQIDGKWIDMACDMAIMLPVLERAERATFCPEVLAIYNFASSWEHRFTVAEREREKRIVRH